jgi:aryl-alcohol dehydrogenase-like predicted oxidoreductase
VRTGKVRRISLVKLKNDYRRICALVGEIVKIVLSLQLSLAWCIRNQTSQIIIISASSPEHLIEMLNSLAVKKCEDVDIVDMNVEFV